MQIKYKILAMVLLFVMVNKVSAQQTRGESLLPMDSLIFSENMLVLSKSVLRLVPVEGQQFNQAYQIANTDNIKNKAVTLRCALKGAVAKGDVLLISFYTRSITSVKETGESFIQLSLDRTVNGKYEWPPLMERGLSFGKQWILTQIPITAGRDVKEGDMTLVLKLGNYPQSVQFGGLKLVNYRQTVMMSSLPKTTVHYQGDETNAAWRKAAADRIEKYRKGDLRIRVINSSGKPIQGARVHVQLKKNAFAFGTAITSERLLDTLTPESRKYRDTLLKYYNKIVFENEMKPRNWKITDHERTIRAIQWLKSRDIDVRGHVMVWPSWQNSPHLLPFKNDTASLHQAITKDILVQTKVMKGQFKEWDVLNEPYAHDDFITLFGRDIMAEWFRIARPLTPGVKLFLNDYTMFHGEGAGSPSEAFFDNIKFLKLHGAPVDMVGEQAHIGGTPPGMDYVISRLNRFAELGLPVQISEFDITSDDDEFKARYLHDFMTAIFSHPSTIGIVQWGFWEGAHWIPAAALWSKNWEPRAHGKVYEELVTHTWNTDVSGLSRKDGNFAVRGFNGDYLVTIDYGKQHHEAKVTLTAQGRDTVIKIQ